jgi:hypothetical protein
VLADHECAGRPLVEGVRAEREDAELAPQVDAATAAGIRVGRPAEAEAARGRRGAGLVERDDGEGVVVVVVMEPPPQS